jgi:cysteine-S-conjugate beta-lyase
MFDFDEAIDRSSSDSIKWQKYRGRDVIPMWVADLDFRSPPAVIDALQQRVSHGVFGYTHPQEALNEVVADYLNRTYDWKVSPDWIVWLPGLVSGLNVTCRSLGRQGEAIVTHIPAYPPFLSAPKLAQRRLHTARVVNQDNRWHFDFEALRDDLPPDAAAYILCNPHNPTGRVLDRAELIQLAQICLERRMTICSDEIHCDLILAPDCRHLPLASIDPEIADQTITLMAPSKTYNIPGLGCAFAVIANDSLRRRFNQTMEGIIPHVNIMGLAATQAAFQHGAEWLKALIAYLRANRDLVHQRINQIPGLRLSSIEATYLAWIDVTALGLPDPAAFFEQAGIGLMDGRDFGVPGFVRMNFGCRQALLNKALDRLTDAVAVLGT